MADVQFRLQLKRLSLPLLRRQGEGRARGKDDVQERLDSGLGSGRRILEQWSQDMGEGVTERPLYALGPGVGRGRRGHTLAEGRIGTAQHCCKWFGGVVVGMGMGMVVVGVVVVVEGKLDVQR